MKLEHRIAKAAINSNAATRVVALVLKGFCDLMKGAGMMDQVAAATSNARDTIMGGAIGNTLNPCAVLFIRWGVGGGVGLPEFCKI